MANHINLPWLDLATIYLGGSVPVSMHFFSKKKKNQCCALEREDDLGTFNAVFWNSNVKKL